MANYDKTTSQAGYGVSSGSLWTAFAAAGSGGSMLAAKSEWTQMDETTPPTLDAAVATAALTGTSVSDAKASNATIAFSNVNLEILDAIEQAYTEIETTETTFKYEDEATIKYVSGGNAAAGYYIISVYYGSKVTSKGRLVIAHHGYIGGDDTMDFAADSQTTNPFSIIPVKVDADTTWPAELIDDVLVTGTPVDIVIPKGAASAFSWQPMA